MYKHDLDKMECYFLKLRNIEWSLLKSATFALRKSDIAKTIGVSLTYVNKLLSEVRSKALIYPVFNFEKMGLQTVYVLTEFREQKLPLYSRFALHLKEIEDSGNEVKLVTGLVPIEYVNEFIESFDGVLDYFIAYENRYLNVINNKFIIAIPYDNKHLVISPLFNHRGFQLEWLHPPEREKYFEVPDPVDLAIITFRKTKNPFYPAVKAVREAMLKSERFRSFLKDKEKFLNQLVAYHFNKHFIKYWKGNAVFFTYPVHIFPPMIMFLEGEDHYLVARILVNMPMFTVASIGMDRSVIQGYLISSYIKNLLKFLSYFNVEWKIYINMKVLGSMTPKYYELVEKTKGGWRWLSEEEVVWARQT